MDDKIETGQKQAVGGKNPPPTETRFKPGQSGNPKGHAKGQHNFQALLNQVAKWKTPKQIAAKIQENFPNAPEKMRVQLAEAVRVHLAALNGEAWAFDRLHGKPQQDIGLFGPAALVIDVEGAPVPAQQPVDVPDVDEKEMA